MSNQIALTTVPAGHSESGKLKLSMLVTLQVTDPVLKPPFDNWPSWLNANNSFDIYFSTGQSVKGVQFINKVLLAKNQAMQELWKKLFNGASITPYLMQRTPESLLSYDSKTISQTVKTKYYEFRDHFGSLSFEQLHGSYTTVETQFDKDLFGPFARDYSIFDGTPAPNEKNQSNSRDRLRLSGALYSNGAVPPLTTVASDTLKWLGGSPVPAQINPLMDLHRWIGRVQRRVDTVTPPPASTEGLDFHKRLSLLMRHPTLMRALGIVLEFEFDSPAFAAGVGVVDVSVAPSSGTISGIAPVSYKSKVQVGGLFAPANRSSVMAYEVQNGTITMDANFELESIDTESACIHTTAYAHEHGKRLARQVKDTHSTDAGNPLLAPPATLTTTGLALYRRGRKAASEALTSTKPDKDGFYAENLLQGFAVDIYDQTTSEWYHPTQKIETFKYKSGPETIDIGAGEIWEAALRMGGTRTTDKSPTDDTSSTQVNISDRVFTWTGPSLASRPKDDTPMPDPNPHKSTATSPWKGTFSDRSVEPPDGAKENKKAWSRLHRGHAYQVSLRPVYVTGDSPEFDAAIASTRATTPLQFTRAEAVPAPRLLLPEALPVQGTEKLTVIVLRTLVSEDLEMEGGNPQSSVRYMVPTAAPLELVRMDSTIDQAFRIDRGFQRIGFADSQNSANGAYDLNLIVSDPDSGPRPKVPYRPDPLSKKARLYLTDVYGNSLGYQDVSFYSDDEDEQWPDCFLNEIEFVAINKESPSITKDGNVDVTYGTTDSSERVLIKIPAGLTLLLHISTLPDSTAIAELAMAQTIGLPSPIRTLPDPIRTKVDKTISAATHPMVTPTRLVQIFHAVSRPIRQPDFATANPAVTDNSTLSLLIQDVPKTANTTRNWETLGLRPFKIVRQNPGSSIAATKVVLVIPPNLGSTNTGIIFTPQYDLNSTGKFRLVANWSEWVDDPKTEAPLLRVQTSVLYETPLSMKQPLNDTDKDIQIVHTLPDAKYYRVRYDIVGTSRYAEMFSPNLPAAEFETPAKGYTYDVLATKQPDEVNLKYILPNFGWRRQTVKASGKKPAYYEHTRNAGVRVFLGRPWYSSGDDELLGVVVLNSADARGQMQSFKSVDVANTGFEASPIENSITRWGGDPIWKQAPPLKLSLSEWQISNPGETNPVGKNSSIRFQPTVLGACGWDLTIPNLNTASTVGVVAYRPIYDDQSQSYYCDIAFDSQPLYATFYRLALVRYQPHAISGKEISNVVLADFALLNADRTLRIMPHGWRSFSIELRGLKAQGHDQNVTIYEVTIEKLDHSVGDAAWYTETVVNSDSDSTGTTDPTLLWRGVVSDVHIGPGQRLVVRESEQVGTATRVVYVDVVNFG